MKRCKFVSHLAAFWHSYKGEEAASTSKFKQCLNNYDSLSHGQCQCPLSLAGSFSTERSCKPRRSINTKKWYTRGTSLSGMKVLADFDKLIGEQTGNTGLRCLIIINVAYLQRSFFFLFLFFGHNMNFERVKKNTLSISVLSLLVASMCYT